MNFRIVRDSLEIAEPTRGALYAGDVYVRTLELPWKDNLPNVSCIPVGVYKTVLAWSNRFQRVMPRLLKVPGRDGILIHSGNTPHNTEGCILVGLEQRSDGGLEDSRQAMALVYRWLAEALRDGDVNVEISYA